MVVVLPLLCTEHVPRSFRVQSLQCRVSCSNERSSIVNKEYFKKIRDTVIFKDIEQSGYVACSSVVIEKIRKYENKIKINFVAKITVQFIYKATK